MTAGRRRRVMPALALLITGVAALAAGAGTNSSATCPAGCDCGPSKSAWSGKTLQHVVCRGRGLVTVPHALPNSTEVLDLSSNRVGSGLLRLGRLGALRQLRLDDNRLQALPRGAPLRRLGQLRLLSLTRNLIRTVYADAFSGLVQLQDLALAFNKIGYIEDETFSDLAALRTLNLSGNVLTAVSPVWFRRLANVTTLDLSHNRLHHIPAGVLTGTTGLRRLDLAANQILSLHAAAFTGPRNISQLDLSANRLSAVPTAALGGAATLDTVELSGNPLAKIPAASFVGLDVRDLRLTGMASLQIVDSGALENLPRLAVLRLNDNVALRFVGPRFVRRAPELRQLLLHNTSLLSLAGELTDEVAAQLELSLHDTALRCDCVLAWLPAALAAGSVKLSAPERSLCTAPEERRGRRLDTLSAAALGDRCGPTLAPLGLPSERRDIGERLTLECRASGRPEPRLRWVTPRGNASDTAPDGGTLVVRHVNEADAGRYWCVAESAEGVVNASVLVRVQEVDIHLFATGVSSKFVTLVWNGTARNNFPQYELMYRAVGGEEGAYRSRTVTPFSRSYTISGLRPSTRYQFCLSYQDRDKRPVRISCTHVRTREAGFMSRGIRREWTAAAAAAAGVAALVLAGLTLLAMAARRYRSRLREEGDKDSGSQIPLESFYSPLLSYSSGS